MLSFAGIVNALTLASSEEKRTLQFVIATSLTDSGKLRLHYASVSVPGKPDSVESALAILAKLPKIAVRMPNLGKGASIVLKIRPVVAGDVVAVLCCALQERDAKPYASAERIQQILADANVTPAPSKPKREHKPKQTDGADRGIESALNGEPAQA